MSFSMARSRTATTPKSGTSFKTDDATYSYCTSGDTLKLTPQLGGITGTVELTKSAATGSAGRGGIPPRPAPVGGRFANDGRCGGAGGAGGTGGAGGGRTDAGTSTGGAGGGAQGWGRFAHGQLALRHLRRCEQHLCGGAQHDSRSPVFVQRQPLRGEADRTA